MALVVILTLTQLWCHGELSDDPVLAARAAIYSQSYNARLREIGFGKATDAVGK